MSEISQKVMNKVRRIYLFRKVGVFGIKLVAFVAMLGFTSLFVSFTDVINNFGDVLRQGSVFLYVSDAFSKTEGVVLILSALALGVFVAALYDIRKMVAGIAVFAR